VLVRGAVWTGGRRWNCLSSCAREYEFGTGTVKGVARKFGVHRRMVVTVRLCRPGTLTVGPVTLRPQRNAKAAAGRSE